MNLGLLIFFQSESEVARHLPNFVINHGVVSQAEVQKLLNESMVIKDVQMTLRSDAVKRAVIISDLPWCLAFPSGVQSLISNL